MSDVRSRRLARRAGEGDASEEAAALADRRRTGAVDPESLALAAYLGHPAARLALGEAAWSLPPRLTSARALLGPDAPARELPTPAREARLLGRGRAVAQRQARAELLPRAPRHLRSELGRARCVQSPVLDQLRGELLVERAGLGGRRPAGWRHEQVELGGILRALEEALDRLDDDLVGEDALLLLGPEAPAFCLRFGRGRAMLPGLFRRLGWGALPVALVTTDLRAGVACGSTVVLEADGVLSALDPDPAGVVFDLATWGSAAPEPPREGPVAVSADAGPEAALAALGLGAPGPGEHRAFLMASAVPESAVTVRLAPGGAGVVTLTALERSLERSTAAPPSGDPRTRPALFRWSARARVGPERTDPDALARGDPRALLDLARAALGDPRSRDHLARAGA